MRLTRWWVGAVAALGLALMIAPVQPAQARFGGHFGGHGFGHAHFHGGGFHGFRHGGFHRHVFIGPRVYAGYPYPYYAPVYRCPVVWTVYGPRRICAYRRHFVHYYYRHPHRHHYVHRYRSHRWM